VSFVLKEDVCMVRVQGGGSQWRLLSYYKSTIDFSFGCKSHYVGFPDGLGYR
jgi:hypothetical protein